MPDLSRRNLVKAAALVPFQAVRGTAANNAIKVGLITTGVAIGQRSKGWPDHEVKAINAARIAGKSETEIREVVTRLHAKRLELATA